VRSIRILLLLAFSALFSVSASAGTAYPVLVTVDRAGGIAYGSVVDARGPNTYLQCMLESGAIACDAKDRYGVEAHCSLDPATNPAFAKNVLAINNASFVAFYWNPATGICTDMRLINGSQFLQAPPAGDRPDAFRVDMQQDDDGRFFVYGGVSSARYFDDNPLEFISCDVWANGYIYCVARDHNGSAASCHTTEGANPSFAERARSIDSAAFVRFELDPSTQVCGEIAVWKGSRYLP
jgi:hypothetical protein